MRVLLAAALGGSILAGSARAQVTTPTPVADYQLQGSYASSTGTLGPLTQVGAGQFSFATATVFGQSQQVLQISTSQNTTTTPTTFTQGGVQTPANPFADPSNYSILLTASFTVSTADVLATKVFDFKNLTTDAGLYINDATGVIQFADDTGATVVGGTGADAVATGAYFQLSLTRTAAGVVTAYMNGTQEFQFTDTNNLATLNNMLTLFKDDGTGLGGTTIAEGTVGTIARLRLYNDVLTPAQIGALAVAIPEPSTWVPLAGGLLLGVAALRRRGRQAACR